LRIGRLASRLVLLTLLLLVLANCRRTTITTNPEQPQQGDPVWITVDNDERAEVRRVEITYGGLAGSSTTVPATFFIRTCKDTEPYMTSLDIRVVTTYVDGAT
ncbi:MAG TPA: hypothetical protein DCE18_08905, partial [Syntrophobacteraceae bacterium]|nr:hypothetical protein [Syntrophobacteraceae bacterium]